MKRIALALVIAGLTSTTAVAAPFAPFDVRSAAMGGAGVASAKSASAALFNPAMLSAQREEDDFQFALGVGANVVDQNDMSDSLIDIADSIDELDMALNNIENSGIMLDTYDPDLEVAADSTVRISASLRDISGGTLNIIPGAVLAFGIPSAEKVGVGIYSNVVGQASVIPMVSASDLDQLDRYAGILADGTVAVSEVTDPANADLFVDTTGTTGNVQLVNPDFTPASEATVVAVATREVGVALAHRFELSNGAMLAAGITPKMVDLVTYDYTDDTQAFDGDLITDTERTDSYADADIGAVLKLSAETNWQFGAVIKNIAAQDQTTSTGRTISMAPQLRAGVGHLTENATFAVDLDLTSNGGTTSADDTQFLAIGYETGGRFGKFRAGYRANLASGSDVPNVATLGFAAGFVSTAFAFGGNTIGANLQISFGW